MSLIWGVTWAATKAGIAVVPPLFFGAVRYILVSAVILLIARDLRESSATAARCAADRDRCAHGGRLLRVPLLGHAIRRLGRRGRRQHVDEPRRLFGFAILFGQERPSWRHALALALGIVGLVILFSGKAELSRHQRRAVGRGRDGRGCGAAYCLGSVLTRPLLDELNPFQLTSAQALVGAVGLTGLSLLLEPVSGATFRALLAPAPLVGVLYLVIAGTFVAYTIFLRLVRDWGAPRAGLYSFVSPVVALALGAIPLCRAAHLA